MVCCKVFISTTSSFLGSSFLANNLLEASPAKSPPPPLVGSIIFVSTSSSFLVLSFLINNRGEASQAKRPPPPLLGCKVFVYTTSSFLVSSFLANNRGDAPPAKNPSSALLGGIPVLGKILPNSSFFKANNPPIYGLRGSSFLALNNRP